MKKNADIYPANAEEAPKTDDLQEKSPQVEEELQARRDAIDKKVADMKTEYGGRPKDKGLEPTRYNDWEFKGRCIDF